MRHAAAEQAVVLDQILDATRHRVERRLELVQFTRGPRRYPYRQLPLTECTRRVGEPRQSAQQRQQPGQYQQQQRKVEHEGEYEPKCIGRFTGNRVVERENSGFVFQSVVDRHTRIGLERQSEAVGKRGFERCCTLAFQREVRALQQSELRRAIDGESLDRNRRIVGPLYKVGELSSELTPGRQRCVVLADARTELREQPIERPARTEGRRERTTSREKASRRTSVARSANHYQASSASR